MACNLRRALASLSDTNRYEDAPADLHRGVAAPPAPADLHRGVAAPPRPANTSALLTMAAPEHPPALTLLSPMLLGSASEPMLKASTSRTISRMRPALEDIWSTESTSYLCGNPSPTIAVDQPAQIVHAPPCLLVGQLPTAAAATARWATKFRFAFADHKPRICRPYALSGTG